MMIVDRTIKKCNWRLILLSLLIVCFIAGCASSKALPTETPTAIPTATEVIESYIEMEYPSGCSEDQIPAGRVVFGFGIGCSDDPECTGIGDNVATMTIDGVPIPPITGNYEGRPLRDDGRTVEVQWHGIQYGYNAYAVIDLEPGVYEIFATWDREDGFLEDRECVLTVVGP